MGISTNVRAVAAVLVVAAFGSVAPAFAANYPLELTNIRAGMSPNSRIARAYPGIEYNIRAAVVGGAYPYVYSLSNAPSGMTINSQTGTISWPNPQANASPTIIVRDSEGTQVSATWTITVTTAGFKFIDAVNGRNAQGNGCTSSCGTGTATNPWRTISDMYYNASATDFIYFRSGTYRVTDLPRESVGGPWERVEFPGHTRAVVWLEYPGQNAIIDFAYGPLIRLDGSGHEAYVDGFETTSCRIICFQTGTAPTFRRLRMHDLTPGGDGTNASFIMTLSKYPNVTTGMVIQDSEFFRWATEAVTLKIYSQQKLLIENNIHHDGSVAVELKADVRQFTVRGDTFYNISMTALGGNMHGCVGCGSGGADLYTTSGEMLFNNSRSSLNAVDLNQDGQARQLFVYRNTFVGRVQVRNTDSNDGPFYLSNNVIVNSDSGTPAGSHVYLDNVSAPSRIVLTNNLAGYSSDGIVDASGNLTAAYAGYIGTHGYQGGGGIVVPTPSAPSNLRIIR